MKFILTLITIALFTSCIPYQIAPNIKDDKVVKGRKFKRRLLPKDYFFVFKDPKDANEFYSYIKIKYDMNDGQIEKGIPFIVDKKLYYFSFYEVEKSTKTLNLAPVVVDAALDNKNIDPIFEDSYTSRIGNWYIAINVFNVDGKDCLDTKNQDRNAILQYLKKLRIGYLKTNNYYEAQLKSSE